MYGFKKMADSVRGSDHVLTFESGQTNPLLGVGGGRGGEYKVIEKICPAKTTINIKLINV